MTTKPSKLPRITLVIGTLEAGGAERMALTLLRELLARGHHAQLVCLGSDMSMPLPGSAQEQYRIRNAITSIGHGTAKQRTLRKALSFPRLHIKLEQSIKHSQADLVISFMERGNILNLLGNRHVPRIISIRKHLSMALKDKSPLKRLLVKVGYRLLLKRAKNINFNAAEAAQDFQQLFPRHGAPISVINNFFDPDMQQLGAQSPGQAAEQLLAGTSVLTAGRLVKVKGHRALIRAFTRVADQIPGAQLIILGEGPLRSELEVLIEDLQLQQNVTLTGFQSNPYAWVSRCHLFVLSSHAEGFPNALLEAMGLARPVISTDCHSGPRELLAPQSDCTEKTRGIDRAAHGVLTTRLERDHSSAQGPLTTAEESLAQAIIELLRNTKAREHYAQQAAHRADDFSRQAILQQWLDLIDLCCPPPEVEQH